MVLMGIGLVLLTIGVSTADSNNVIIPFVLALAGAMCLFIGQNSVELEEEEDEEWITQ